MNSEIVLRKGLQLWKGKIELYVIWDLEIEILNYKGEEDRYDE